MENLKFSPQRTVMSFRRYLLNTVLPIICYGGIVGSLVGVIVWAYNFAAEKISETTLEIYTYVGQKLYFLQPNQNYPLFLFLILFEGAS